MGLSAAAALLFLFLGAPRSVADVVGVQLIGERVFPNGDAAAAGALAQLGGLTALSYDHSLDRWFAASIAEQRCDCPTWFVASRPLWLIARCPIIHAADCTSYRLTCPSTRCSISGTGGVANHASRGPLSSTFVRCSPGSACPLAWAMLTWLTINGAPGRIRAGRSDRTIWAPDRRDRQMWRHGRGICCGTAGTGGTGGDTSGRGNRGSFDQLFREIGRCNCERW